MALPSFLQSMFTPTGPPRQRVDQGGGEYTGSIAGVYEGDDSSPVFPRSITSQSVSGPTTRRLPPPNATTGMGQNAGQDIQDAIRSIAPGMDGGGMDDVSITEVMQTTPVGDEFGGAPAMGYATPSDPMGGGLDRMLGDSRFGGGAQPSYSMRDEFAEEGPGMFSAGAPMATPDVVGGVTGVPRPEHGGWATPLYNPFGVGSGMMGDQGLSDTREVAAPSLGPTAGTDIASLLQSLMTSPTQRGQLGPLSEQGQADVAASRASAPWGRDRLGRPRLQQTQGQGIAEAPPVGPTHGGPRVGRFVRR